MAVQSLGVLDIKNSHALHLDLDLFPLSWYFTIEEKLLRLIFISLDMFVIDLFILYAKECEIRLMLLEFALLRGRGSFTVEPEVK